MKQFLLKILNTNKFFEREVIRCENEGKDSEYLYRWRFLFNFPYFNIYLHNFKKPDTRVFHDHPWDFISIVLSGAYHEQRPGELTKYRKAGTIIVRTAEASHYVEGLEGDVWTLVIRGPYRRMWGFWTPKGWVDHITYHKNENYNQ